MSSHSLQYRSYLSPNIRTDNMFVVLSALVFLTMAEWMHLLYSGLTSEELQERIHAMGHRTFAILAAIPRLGLVIIRNVEIVMIADSPALACGLIVASTFPALIFPLILLDVQKIQGRIANRRGQHAPEHNGAENTPMEVTGHSESQQSELITDGIESSVCHNCSSEGRSGFDLAIEERD
ncbi:hypothetical protein BKA82DRAFT_997032 [Pisolithus tinctorius]|uniref:Uncharacterized protein n=1 Tax=Pisolithus tinctorius Marx 270 TaxID=870435 RepID=A0A0C3PKR5_PISTI|nr:hypothetical protein BKA82DRAFT_997032 [Pisolithus tinctorius]KIO08824.1 hypothetical protein M404DRAFT_997032 [Pisolithus tinctorius Marx 270]